MFCVATEDQTVIGLGFNGRVKTCIFSKYTLKSRSSLVIDFLVLNSVFFTSELNDIGFLQALSKVLTKVFILFLSGLDNRSESTKQLEFWNSMIP